MHITAGPGKEVVQFLSINETPSNSYGVSLAVWDHTVLPPIGHK